MVMWDMGTQGCGTWGHRDTETLDRGHGDIRLWVHRDMELGDTGMWDMGM